MIVSICFTWFPIGSLGKLNIYHQPNIYHQLDFYTRTANFTWGVSDCEGVGSTHRRCWGVGFRGCNCFFCFPFTNFTMMFPFLSR